MKYVTTSILRDVYHSRPTESHKGDYGRVLVIGGNEEFSGAPALAAMGAMRAGADIARIVSPRRSADIIAQMRPDFITVPLEGSCLDETHVHKILKLAGEHDAVVIGNGLGTEKKTMRAVAHIVKKIRKPCVVDADAIKALAQYKITKKECVITPHAGEFKVLTGKQVTDDIKKNISFVRQHAKKIRATIILKGHVDIISDGTSTAINKTGNPYMTKGGTGDVLAGVCGALLAQRNSLFESACAAAYITGKAGDIVAVRRKQSLLASEVADAIREVIR